ncbi:MAG: ATP-dependent Clp protease adapter ClpS [Candidatus Nanopelagicales bacterium]
MSISPLETTAADTATQVTTPWVCIVWNDPINLMGYVTYVFMSYFGYSKSKADKLMMDVHTKGKAIVNQGSREEMERDVSAMHSYGLMSTLEKSTS